MLLGHRFFDPSVGRFLTRDPIKDGRNWYGYGGGCANPVKSADPNGLHPVLAAVGAGLALVDGIITVKDLIEDPHDPINWLSIIPIAKPIKWGKRIGDALGAVRSAIPKSTHPVAEKLAGKKHPVTGVPYDKKGYPAFPKKLILHDVKIEPTGSRSGDFRAANRKAGLSDTPLGYTWHHHQERGRMQLVPTDLHKGTPHTGGWAIWGHPKHTTR